MFTHTAIVSASSSCLSPPSSPNDSSSEDAFYQVQDLDGKCASFVDYSLYASDLSEVLTVTQTVAKRTVMLGVGLPFECRNAALRLLCLFSYRRCKTDQSGFELPCVGVCEEAWAYCEEPFRASGQLSQLPPCTIFSNSSCNNAGEATRVPYSSVDCPYPTTFHPDSLSPQQIQQDPTQQCVLPCPSPIYSEEEWDALFATITVFSVISFLLSLFYVVTAFLHPRTRTFPTNLPQMLPAAGLPVAFGLMMGLFAGGMRNIICEDDTTYQEMGEGEEGGFGCVLQAISVTYGGIAISCWWFILSFNMLLLINCKLSRDNLNKVEKWYHLFGWGLPLIGTIVPLAAHKMKASPTLPWCFIYDEDTDWWLYGNFYILVTGSWFFGSLILLSVIAYLLKRTYDFRKESGMPVTQFIRLAILLASFWVLSSFVIAYRFYGTGIKTSVESALEHQIRCSAITGAECSLEERPNYGFLFWTSFVLSNFGTISFLVLGTNKSVFPFWRDLLRDVWKGKGLDGKWRAIKANIDRRERARTHSMQRMQDAATRARKPSVDAVVGSDKSGSSSTDLVASSDSLLVV
ncbi:hypothetical protein QOT17_006037 [Balamuthia mandrillaris]